MSPITHPELDLFLLGFITAASFAAGLFFLRFWKNTRDILFLAFALFFFFQGASHAFVLNLVHPNQAGPGLFLIRLISVLVVLAAVLWKNTGRR